MIGRRIPVVRAEQRLRWAGFVAACGNGITGTALSITLATAFPTVGVTLSLTALSIGLLLSFASGGHRADTGNRVRIMVHTDVIRAIMNIVVVVAVTMTAIDVRARIVFAGVACFGNGLMAGYFRPAQASLWASIVPKEKLTKVLGANAFLNRFGLAVGGAAGGVFIGFSRGAAGIAVDSLSFLVTAMLVRGIADPRAGATARHDTGGLSFGVRVFRAGLLDQLRVDRDWERIMTLTRKSLWLRLWLVCRINASWTTSVMTVAAPIVLVRQYPLSAGGAFQSASVIALLAGSVVAYAVPNIPYAGALDAWKGIGDAISYALLGLNAPIGYAVAARASAYGAQSACSPRLNAYIAEEFDDRERGQMYAAIQGAGSVLAPIGMLLGSMLMGLLAPGAILIVAAALTLVLNCVPLCNRSYWTLKVQSHA